MAHLYFSILHSTNLIKISIGSIGKVVKQIDKKGFCILSECKEDSFFVFGAGFNYTSGIISYDGKILVSNAKFKYISQFSDNRAWARGFINDKSVEGFIDKNGIFKIIKGKSQF